MHANHREEIQSIGAGDICAVIGLKSTFTGDTLCDPAQPDRARVDQLPGAGDRGLRSSRRRVPTRTRWAWRSAAWPKRTRPSACARTRRPARRSSMGMGELHLEVIVDRMLREFRVDANVGQPQVAYRETITMPVRAEGATSARPAVGVSTVTSWLEFEPQERGHGLRVRGQDRRRLGSARVHPAGRRRVSRKRC